MRVGIYVTLTLSICLQLFYFSGYPESVANHFGSNGLPNGWMSNTGNLLIGVTVVLINSTMFLAMPYIFRHTPVKYLSFPNKAYWFAEERREISVDIASKYMYFIGLITNIFLIAVFHLVYLANQSQPPRLNEAAFAVCLSTYLLVFVVWLVVLFKKFNRSTP